MKRSGDHPPSIKFFALLTCKALATALFTCIALAWVAPSASAQVPLDRLGLLRVGGSAGVFVAGQSTGDARMLIFGAVERKGPRVCAFFPGEWKRFVEVVSSARERMFTLAVTSPQVVDLWRHRSTVAGAHAQVVTARLAVKRDPVSHDWRTFLEIDVGNDTSHLMVSFSDTDIEKLQKLMARGTDYLEGTLSLSSTDAHEDQTDDRTRLDVGKTSGSTTAKPSVTRGVVAAKVDTTFKNGWLVHITGQVQPLCRYHVRINKRGPLHQVYVACVRGSDCVIQPVSEGFRVQRDDEIEFVGTASVAPENDP